MAGLDPFTTLLSRVTKTLVAAKEQRNTMRKGGECLQVDAPTSQPLGILSVKDISFWVREAKGGDRWVWKTVWGHLYIKVTMLPGVIDAQSPLLQFLSLFWAECPHFPICPKNRGILTAGAAFVPEDVFWCGSKDKPYILQHPLWAEDIHCRVLVGARGSVVGGTVYARRSTQQMF